LPARSPIPFTVTWTCRAPASTAMVVLATASPKSLWQWTSIFASTSGAIPRTIVAIDVHRCWGGDPDGVGEVDDRRPCGGCGSADLQQVGRLGPGRVHRREHALVVMLPNILDDRRGAGQHLLPGLLDRMDPLDIRGRDEDMDQVDITVEACVHIGLQGPGKATDLRVQIQGRDGSNRFAFACR